MNPYALLGAGVIWLASLTAVGVWQRHDGAKAQAYADQAQFDKLNNDVQSAKDQAGAVLLERNSANLALMEERVKFNNQLEKTRADNQAITAALRRKYDDVLLRFRPDQAPVRGDGGSSAGSPTADAPGPEGTAAVELPGPLTRDLRRLVEDADSWLDEYRTCFQYAQSVRCH